MTNQNSPSFLRVLLQGKGRLDVRIGAAKTKIAVRAEEFGFVNASRQRLTHLYECVDELVSQCRIVAGFGEKTYLRRHPAIRTEMPPVRSFCWNKEDQICYAAIRHKR